MNEASCCSKENPEKNPKSNSSCCGAEINTNNCCSKTEPLNSNFSDLKVKVDTNLKNNRIRNYATASIIALSAILVSRIALKMFYNNK